jgi:type IV pilus assembly protein PilW
MTFNLQQGTADVQDSGVFGMELMARSIRAANYNNASRVINDRTPWGGIVLTSDMVDDPIAGDLPRNLEGLQWDGNFAPSTLLTRGNGHTVGLGNDWTGKSNVSLAAGGSVSSDQLVIQYQAHEDMFDCEGQTVLGPRLGTITQNGQIVENHPLKGDMVIERYFLRVDTLAAATEPGTPLALACDAGRYNLNNAQNVKDNKEPIVNYGDAGQILMNRVDHFHVLLGTEANNSTNQLFYSIRDYMTLPEASRPRIVSVKMSVLSRSTANTKSKQIDTTKEFVMLDQKVKVNTATNNEYVRQVYSTTIALRNGIGGRPS